MLPQRTRERAAPTRAKSASVAPANLPTLQVSRNGELLEELPFDVPRILIGRSDENHVAIPSEYVSRYHILLVRHGAATILIDLNSTNGTFVNSKRAYTKVLADNDVITIDQHSMFVQYSIKYNDPGSAGDAKLGDVESVDEIIASAVAEVAALLGKEDTDLLPALSENTPTELGCIDDR